MNRPINDSLAPKSRVANNPRFCQIWERLQKNLGEILSEAYNPKPHPPHLSPYAGTVRTCIADLNDLMGVEEATLPASQPIEMKPAPL